MRIKKICFLLTLLMSLTCICSLTSDVKADETTNTLDELFNIQDFLGRDYSSLANTKQIGKYYMRYYIKDLITFVYNDNTFGNTEQGTYPLNVIKEYK